MINTAAVGTRSPWVRPLRFGAATSDRVRQAATTAATEWGTANPGPSRTLVFLLMPTTLTSGRLIWNRDSVNLTHIVEVSGTAGAVHVRFDRATTDDDLVTSTAVLKLNRWNWLFVTRDTAASQVLKAYIGSLTDPVQLAGTASSVNGAGALDDDTAHLTTIGNSWQASPTLAFQGLIGLYGMVGRVLSLGEMRRIQAGGLQGPPLVVPNLLELLNLGENGAGQTISSYGMVDPLNYTPTGVKGVGSGFQPNVPLLARGKFRPRYKVVSTQALFAASATGTATAVADLTTAITMAASVNAVATATAPLTTAIRMAAQATGTATATAPLTTSITFAASATGTASVVAPLTTAIRMAASVTGTASVVAPLTTLIRMAASVTGVVTSTADLSAGSGFSASVTGTATATAPLTTSIRFAASATGAVTTAAALTTAIRLAASVTGVVTTSASLAGGQALFGASVTGTASAVAALTTAIRFAASATGSATTAGALTTSITLAASALGSASALAALTAGISVILTGVLSVFPALSGMLAVQPTSTGTLSVETALSGSFAVQPTSSGRLAVSSPLTGALRVIPE